MDDGECAQRLENTGPHRGEGFQMFCLPSKNNTLFDWYKPKTSICLFPIEARTRTVQPVYKVMYGKNFYLSGILSGVRKNDFVGIISAEAYHQKLRPNFSLMDQDFASLCQIERSYIHPLCMAGEKKLE